MRALFPGMLACFLAALVSIGPAQAAPLTSSTISLDASDVDTALTSPSFGALS